MKRIILLSAITILTVAQAFADHSGLSILNVRADNHDRVFVKVDGHKTGKAASDHTIRDLTPGTHRVEVYQLRRSSWSYRPYKVTIFKGRIDIGSSVEIWTVASHHHGLQIEKEIALAPVYDDYYDDYYYDNEEPWACGSGGHHDHGGGYDDHHYEPVAMSEADFQQLKRSIRNATFESGKLAIARQGIGSNYVNSNQVKRLMNAFTFESSKVEIAKFAYENTIDKERYYIVYDAFTFSSSINELDRFIASR